MPTFSDITIKFTGDFEVGDFLKMKTVKDNAIYMLSSWEWVAARSSGFEISTGIPTVNIGERTALNFKIAFDLDNPTGYILTVGGVGSNEVLIESETEDEIFMGMKFSVGESSGGDAEIDSINNDDTNDVIQDITVMIEKYFIIYCDDFNTDREVVILERAFIGLALPLLADVNPILISYESSEDFKFSPIRPSTAEVFMIFGSGDGIDFEEFWTGDERQFMVQDIKDGTVEWSGFVNVNGFQYEFHGGLYHATITASDGLGTLEAIDFVDDNQKPYGNQNLVYNTEFSFPFSLIITEILNKLGLSLDLWTCVDSYETNMIKVGDVREADPLSASEVNVKTFIKEGEDENIPYWYGSGEEWNCQEVLENILYIFGAKLYQEVGVWRLKTINADIDYGTGVTQRYWRKYNTAGVYLGNFETINDEIAIPCDDNTKFLLENDHVMSMDDVYKAFRMNYEYTFLRDGDTPLNLLPNGDFCDFDNNSILAAPTGWERWRRDDKWYIRIKDIVIPFADAGGHTCGIEIGTHKAGIPTQQGTIRTDPNPAIWTSLRTASFNSTNFVEKGSKLFLKAWNKYRHISPSGGVAYYPVYRCMLVTPDKFFFLRNSIVDNKRGYTWERGELIETGTFNPTLILKEVFFYLNYFEAKNATSVLTQTFDWWEFDFQIADAPEAGYIEFHIHGLAADSGRNSTNFPAFNSYKEKGSPIEMVYSNWLRVVRKDWIDQGGDIPRLQMTGMVLGVIPNESELPQQQDFIYENTNENYSLQVDPITIYNGDLQDALHISSITVPSNTTGKKNFWDDLGENYGSSSLGLLTVREIMRQYQKPYRILEGSVKIQDARFGTVYTFAVLAGIRFILQRGSFNKQKQFIEDATFVQLTSDVLPDGGRESGNTLDAEWIPTGNSYCELDGSQLNTGNVIIEQSDQNPNSETYQDTREIVLPSQDLVACPLSQPRLYYWGSDDIYLETGALNFTPFEVISNKEIQVSFDNEDGNYLYFVHLKTLGVVERVYTNTTPNNVLEDWVNLSDVIIDGYTYRVMRTDYVMAEFSNFTHNFKFA